jgi:hypothetical protein
MRGTTNEPPDNWFTKIETRKRPPLDLLQPADQGSPKESNLSETSEGATEEDPAGRSTLIQSRPDWRMFLLGSAACALLFCATLLLYNHYHPLLPRNQMPASPFWSEVFSKDRETFIVPADSGLGILQNLTEQQTSLADYISGKYLTEVHSRNIDSSNLDDLRTQRYTSIADVNIIARLSLLPDVVHDRSVIRFARDLRMEDLEDGNAILLGAIHSDPWVDLFQKQLNFQFVCESHVNHCSIVNSHPTNTEKAIYDNESQQMSHRTFGVVAFIPNLNRTGKILLVEGLNMAATQAAADTLMDETRMRPIVQKATLQDGSVGPFELLIETTSVDAAALPSHIVAERFEH